MSKQLDIWTNYLTIGQVLKEMDGYVDEAQAPSSVLQHDSP